MKEPTREEQQLLVRQWEETGRELEQIRTNALRGMAYDWAAVDAVLEMADYYDGEHRTDSGLVEMQRWFMKAERRPQSPHPARP